MLHKHAQTDILSDVVAALNSSVISGQWARIDPVLDLPLVGIPRLAYKEARHGKPLAHYVFGVFDGLFEKDLEVFIGGVVLVPRIFPLHDGLTLPDCDIEKGVQEENHVVFHGINI